MIICRILLRITPTRCIYTRSFRFFLVLFDGIKRFLVKAYSDKKNQFKLKLKEDDFL